MYQNCCKKCGSTSLHTEIKGNNTGLYCDDCGAYIKWLSKDELRAFEHSKKENHKNNTEPDSKDTITRLKEFAEYLDKVIDKEYEKLPMSPEDTIRKSSYCLALERNKNAIWNIINGKDFSYTGD
ncbi:hypothetical protein [Lacrimispora indolis]|uniref:hypothetical protein n=1 Tax=Lacrimispora indolis TaxID=69825 RepID=UPI0004628FC6|nr:hypothetical protein [[Clostridium] methoxybenzovorans]